jgi:hypothetical protein
MNLLPIEDGSQLGSSCSVKRGLLHHNTVNGCLGLQEDCQDIVVHRYRFPLLRRIAHLNNSRLKRWLDIYSTSNPNNRLPDNHIRLVQIPPPMMEKRALLSSGDYHLRIPLDLSAVLQPPLTRKEWQRSI